MGASTIKDVARKAAVSVGTVSKYLNGLPCSPGRSARIKEAIELLNYKRNPFARSTRTAKSYCIGLVVEKRPGMTVPYGSKGGFPPCCMRFPQWDIREIFIY